MNALVLLVSAALDLGEEWEEELEVVPYPESKKPVWTKRFDRTRKDHEPTGMHVNHHKKAQEMEVQYA